jgi:prefoldin subunit 5
MRRLSMAIMSSKKEIADFKKIIDKLVEWIHHMTANLYSEELEKLQQRQSKNKGWRVNSC